MSTALQPPDDLTQRFEGVSVANDGAWELSVPADEAHAALAYLGREREPAFALFIDLFGIDYGDEFEVVYQASRPLTAEVVRVHVRVPRRGGSVQSVTDIWAGAGWPERELMEMYGVAVEGHPDPRHLLLPDDWKGFPLRKDYEYPLDHPYLAPDPMREDPGKYLSEHPSEN